MDVLASALAHEKEAVNLYRYLAEEASLTSLKRLFLALLRDEQKHLERLSGFNATLEDSGDCKPEDREFSRLFPQIVEDRGIEGLCREEVHFYREVMECERNGISRYRNYLSNTHDEKSKKLLTEIMLQERIHFDVVKELCVFISEQQSSK